MMMTHPEDLGKVGGPDDKRGRADHYCGCSVIIEDIEDHALTRAGRTAATAGDTLAADRSAGVEGAKSTEAALM